MFPPGTSKNPDTYVLLLVSGLKLMQPLADIPAERNGGKGRIIIELIQSGIVVTQDLFQIEEHVGPDLVGKREV